MVLSTTLLPNFKKLVTSQALSVLLGTQIVVWYQLFSFPFFKLPGQQKEPPASRRVIQQLQICHQQEVPQVSRKSASNVRIFLEFLPDIKSTYTSALDILKLDVYPNTFLHEKISLQTKRCFGLFKG